jgi:hypothetical protein
MIFIYNVKWIVYNLYPFVKFCLYLPFIFFSGVGTVLLLDTMSLYELQEAIDLLSKKLFEKASIKGFSDERTIEISRSLQLYQNRYYELKRSKNLQTFR